ncbi:MAG: hypothetical protein J6Q45_04005 [Alistipes sp.]|nr:hypothetical protein [Alistipes sp.]
MTEQNKCVAISFGVKGRFPSSASPPGNDVFILYRYTKPQKKFRRWSLSNGGTE